MTSLVLGLAGGAIGFMVGGPVGAQIGFLAGSLIGSLIDPPKIEGPRLGDTKLQRSSYGVMIPYVWGHGRMGGNVIDQTDLIEHKNVSGGKGGPEVTNYTYSASFCIALAQRLPNRTEAILGITDMWLDGRLVWSTTTGGVCPCTVYLGTETQEPDPTFEAIHGQTTGSPSFGQVPAYRGIAYLVFADFDLTDFGNRIPNVEVAVFTKGGVIPWRVTEFSPFEVPNHLTLAATYENGEITVTETAGATDVEYTVTKFNIDGTVIYGPYAQTVPGHGGLNISARNLDGRWLFDTSSGSEVRWFEPNRQDLYALSAGFEISPDVFTAPMAVAGNANVYMNDYVYTSGGKVGSFHTVGRYFAPNGVPTSFVDSVSLGVDALGNSNVGLGTSDTGDLYVMVPFGTCVKIFKFDADLNPITSWDDTVCGATGLLKARLGNFLVYKNMICYKWSPTAGTYGTRLVLIDGATLTDTGATLTHGNISWSSTLSGGLCIDQEGVFSLDPPPAPELLSDIASDITSLTPATSYDMAELTDEVRWYPVASQMTARNALEELRAGFFFDIVEEDYFLIARKRGNRAIVDIPDGDLCARPYGEDSPDPLKTVRRREQELPRAINFNYIDVEMEYQTGSQPSYRQVTQSEMDVSIEVSVGFTPEEAAQKAETIMHAEWNERESFLFSATRKWTKITPATLVRVRNRVIRVQKVVESPGGVLGFEGVLAAASLYTQFAPGASSSSPSQSPPRNKVATQLVLLDIPILSQHDSPFGFYAAMGPASDGPWPGAALFKSLDGGVTYNPVAATNVRSVIGQTTTASVGSPTVGGVLAPYAGGDVVDESSICVVLSDVDAELSSCTALALTNGANFCAIARGIEPGSPIATLDWELCQFRDAVLIADNTYILTGWLRGRKQTLTSGHATGDRFVLLPVTNVDAPEGELNVSLKYKAVTFGLTLAATAAQDFINTGRSARAFFGTEVGHLPPFGGDAGSPGGGGTPGIVPAPPPGACAAGMYLDACGNWSVPPSGVSSGPAWIVVAQAYSASITFDLSTYSAYAAVVIDITLTGNLALNFSNGTDGQIVRIRLKQDGTGNRTWTPGAAIRFSSDLPSFPLTSTVNKMDQIGGHWNGATSTLDVVAVTKGF